MDSFEIFQGKENSYGTYNNNGIPTSGGVGGATNALGESLPGTSQVFGGFTARLVGVMHRASGQLDDFQLGILAQIEGH